MAAVMGDVAIHGGFDAKNDKTKFPGLGFGHEYDEQLQGTTDKQEGRAL